MASINKVILVGRLGADPEARSLTTGTMVCTFRIATEYTWKKDGERQSKTEWHTIVAWGKLGEICAEHLEKGKLVYIEGRLETEKWKDKEGNDRYTTKVVADTMQMLSSKGEGGGSSPRPKKNEEPAPAGDASPEGEPEFDDDIPF